MGSLYLGYHELVMQIIKLRILLTNLKSKTILVYKYYQILALDFFINCHPKIEMYTDNLRNFDISLTNCENLEFID